MKKIIIVLIVCICLSLISTYFFIPATLVLSKVLKVKVNSEAATRVIVHSNKWQQAFGDTTNNPVDSIKPGKFIYNRDTFRISDRHQTSLDISIINNNTQVASTLGVLPVSVDSIAFHWQCEINSGKNPFVKIANYSRALVIKKNMSGVLNKLSLFLQKDENLYGLRIYKTSTTDTFLIATKAVLNNYPTTSDIYTLVGKLENHLAQKGGKPTNAPMLNVTKGDGNNYKLMVAIPTNVKIADEKEFFFRRMVPGFFLVTEVKGGLNAINKANENVYQYISDHRKTSMAIPFQSLISDRSKEADSTKWITRIHFPINY